jgi:hypothetical protein
MKKLSILATSALGVGIIGLATAGIASAATPTNPNIGTSGISRSVFKQDKLEAEAEVLNTATANVTTAHKDKTFATLLSNADLTKATYHQKVKAELTTELGNQGYSQDQITIALQHHTIAHLRHHHKTNK